MVFVPEDARHVLKAQTDTQLSTAHHQLAATIKQDTTEPLCLRFAACITRWKAQAEKANETGQHQLAAANKQDMTEPLHLYFTA